MNKKIVLTLIAIMIASTIQFATCDYPLNTPMKQNDYAVYKAFLSRANITYLIGDFMNSGNFTGNFSASSEVFDKFTETLDKSYIKFTMLEPNYVSQSMNFSKINTYIYIEGYTGNTAAFNITGLMYKDNTNVGYDMPEQIDNYNVTSYFPIFVEKAAIQESATSMKVIIQQMQLDMTIDYFDGQTRFAAGANRQAFGMHITFNKVITFYNKIREALNQPPVQAPEMTLDIDVAWDSQYKILLCATISGSLETVSFIRYRAAGVSIDSTNMWSASITDQAINSIMGMPQTMIQLFADGFIFGDTTSAIEFIGIIAGIIAITAVVAIKIKKKKST